uniref:Uncharacterized protein n=1 Tax=uncultured bacterium contig00055 TaxID=1181539 RepID=A0A806KR77_9BACT|nr:hypothetical protein [uncultured bacterium contig00055]
MAFLRSVEIIVGPKGGSGFIVKDLKIAFNIEKTNGVDCNESKIRIYNMSLEMSNKVSVSGNHITLRAGYKDESIAAIFFGDVLKGHRYRDGTEIVTELTVFDGRSAVMTAPVSISYAKGTDAKTVASYFLDAIGLPYKGLENIPGGAYDHGYTYIGMAGDGLREVLNRYGLSYTIQNEMVFILKEGESADETGLKLTPKTGLLSTPQAVSDKTGEDDEEIDAANRWKFTTMLFPELLPGAACSVGSDTLNGEVIIEKAVFSGDNWLDDFKIDIEAVVA